MLGHLLRVAARVANEQDFRERLSHRLTRARAQDNPSFTCNVHVLGGRSLTGLRG